MPTCRSLIVNQFGIAVSINWTKPFFYINISIKLMLCVFVKMCSWKSWFEMKNNIKKNRKLKLLKVLISFINIFLYIIFVHYQVQNYPYNTSQFIAPPLYMLLETENRKSLHDDELPFFSLTDCRILYWKSNH